MGIHQKSQEAHSYSYVIEVFLRMNSVRSKNYVNSGRTRKKGWV